MGCGCSRDLGAVDAAAAFDLPGVISAGTPQPHSGRPDVVPSHLRHQPAPSPPGPAPLSPQQVLALCKQCIEEEEAFQAAGLSHHTLAALALTQSGGRTDASSFREDVGDTCIGLGQVTLSTARFLSQECGYTRYGLHPSRALLQQPGPCLYYTAAYLSWLGPQAGATRHQHHHHQQLQQHPRHQQHQHTQRLFVDTQQQQQDQHLEEPPGACSTYSNSSSCAGTTHASAPHLADSYPASYERLHDSCPAAACPAGSADAQGHLWCFSEAAQQGTCSFSPASLEEWRVMAYLLGPKGGGSRSPAAAEFWLKFCKARQSLALLESAQASLQHKARQQAARAQRMGRRQWLGRELAAVSSEEQQQAADDVCGAGAGAVNLPLEPTTAAAPADGSWDSSSNSSCSASGSSGHLMHVLQPGEDLEQVAAVCGTSVAAILAANPELWSAEEVQPHDCIALPVPLVLPRLYVLQPGDTLRAVAKAHGTTVGRLLLKNPELLDTSRVQPGWVVMLPGLKGDSSSTLDLSEPLEVARRANAAAAAAAAAAWGGGRSSFPGSQSWSHQPNSWLADDAAEPDQFQGYDSARSKVAPTRASADAAAGSGSSELGRHRGGSDRRRGPRPGHSRRQQQQQPSHPHNQGCNGSSSSCLVAREERQHYRHHHHHDHHHHPQQQGLRQHHHPGVFGPHGLDPSGSPPAATAVVASMGLMPGMSLRVA